MPIVGSRRKLQLRNAYRQFLSEGGRIIDLGGYSSRPVCRRGLTGRGDETSGFCLKILNTHYPDVTLSVDTFRADVARRCVEEYGVAIINDISGGELDAGMFETVAVCMYLI